MSPLVAPPDEPDVGAGQEASPPPPRTATGLLPVLGAFPMFVRVLEGWGGESKCNRSLSSQDAICIDDRKRRCLHTTALCASPGRTRCAVTG